MKLERQNTANGISAGSSRSETIQQFAADVRAGLGGSPKRLPCVYFYDRAGSLLFERICRQPEYYCTRAEGEILQKHARDIAACCSNPIQIVELGSGSSAKTRILLKAFMDARLQTTYVPIDVSQEILAQSAADLRRIFPHLKVKPVTARYEDGLERLDPADGPILLVWLGSSIGNYERKAAKKFLAGLRRQLSAGDNLLLGVDLIKDREILEAAYNDRSGVTAAFNLNLLTRINRELGGTFDLDRFDHEAIFNAAEGRIEMYLVSRCEQEVRIEALDLAVCFSKGERIHTENSHKYRVEEIADLVGEISETPVRQWFDSRNQFSLSLFEVNNDGFV
jgi:L-histidine N-alpha-methyltransferase